MDLKDVKAKKLELEKAIHELVKGYEIATGTNVNSIQIGKRYINELGKPQTWITENISVGAVILND